MVRIKPWGGSIVTATQQKCWVVYIERIMEEDNFELSEDDFNHLMDYYLEIGAVEISGVLDSGEIVYKITDLAQEAAPELWLMHMESVDEAMIELYKEGLVDVTYYENLEASFKISEEGKERMKQLGFISTDNDKFPGDE